jgi:hypothetical protein
MDAVEESCFSNFFRKNFPYGMKKNEEGKWMIFNRDYQPLGYYINNTSKDGLTPYFCKYLGLDEKLIYSAIERDLIYESSENGKIFEFFFYNDKTNPVKNEIDNVLWNIYIDRVKKFCNLKCR